MNKNKKIKKLNNKGFAISTVLYSLLIMVFLIVILIMSIMASNRKSTHDLVETVEDDLNRYSVSNTKFEFSDVSDGNPKEYQVPNSGWYRIELWGASGGSTTSETGKEQAGGKGAYTSGVTYFDKGTLLYFYIGGTTTTAAGGTNGGGNGGTKTGKGGGGSTDVRTKSGNWDLVESLQSRIMIAAGGGGADGLGDGSPGGEGGETFGASGSANKIKSGSAEYTNAKYGGQTGSKRWSFINIKTYSENCNGAVIKIDGNIFHKDEKSDNKTCGSLGEGGGVPYDSGGGGGAGYVGGGAGNQYNDIAGSGAGGSSFIAGYSNMNYITKFSSRDELALFVDDGRYFIDGQMTAGVNEGNGAARIEYISSNSKDNKPIKNEQLKNVRYIKDCSYGTVKDKTKVIWSEISAINENGKKVEFDSKKSSITGQTTLTGNIRRLTDKNLETNVEVSKAEASEVCLKVELSETSNLNEISVIHDWEKSDNPLIGHSLSVSSDNTNWTALIASESNTQENIIEKTSGTRYTNCNLNTSNHEIPDGVYYIYSALAPYNQALTAKNANDVTDAMDRSKQYVRIEPQQTTAIQEWAIGKIPNTAYYKIVETNSNTALQVKDSLGQSDTQVNTASGYNDDYQWTQWQIVSQKDGTYIIQARIGSNYLTARTNSYYTSSDVKIMSKGTSGFLLSQRWILKPVNL